jgi:pyridoxamine 5'-phosphate oxidase
MTRSDEPKESSRPLLDEATIHPDPIEQFLVWFEAAQSSAEVQPSAITLATAARDGKPSARIVLLKSVNEAGFSFFTNYDSRKGRELAENPRAALVCYWASLERQVRIEGTVTRLPPEESDAYFATRPFGSRLSTWASPQSRVVTDRTGLDRRMAELREQYREDVPRPPYWGGYVLAPSSIEFWQGRADRLHDRILYTRAGEGRWRIERLAP